MAGKRATYALSNATPVYAAISSSAGTVTDGSLHVDFDALTSFVAVDLSVRLPTQSYNLKGGVVGTGSGFSGQVSMSNPDCVAGLGANTCSSATISGGFSGPNATNALLSFSANSLANGNFGGAAVLAQSTVSASIPTHNSYTDLRVVLSDISNTVVGSSYYTTTPDTMTTFFNAELLTGLTLREAPSTTSIKNSNGSAAAYGAVGLIGAADFIGWGHWNKGDKKILQDQPPCTESCSSAFALDSVHYLVGRPTAVMPTSGTGVYKLVGGSAPTSSLQNTGELLSANLLANFNLGTATATINTRFGRTLVDITQAVTFTAGTPSFTGSTTGTVNTHVTGFFNGSNAYRAGLVYATDAVRSVGQVSGAAVLQKQ